MDGATRFFLLSGLAVGVVILASLPDPVNSQWPFPSKPCRPSCRKTADSGFSNRDGEEDPEIAIQRHPDIQAKLEQLKAQAGETGSGSGRENQEARPVSPRCPCEGKCRVKKEQLHFCDGCRVFWPFNGVTDVTCGGQRTCSLGGQRFCGCRGSCTPEGPRRQWVLLYCPGSFEPFRVKQITLCSNCCCRQQQIYRPTL